MFTTIPLLHCNMFEWRVPGDADMSLKQGSGTGKVHFGGLDDVSLYGTPVEPAPPATDAKQVRYTPMKLLYDSRQSKLDDLHRLNYNCVSHYWWSWLLPLTTYFWTMSHHAARSVATWSAYSVQMQLSYWFNVYSLFFDAWPRHLICSSTYDDVAIFELVDF